MGNTYSVYMHENNINHKKYIGLTKREPALRWQNGTAYRNNKHFDAAIRKYGWNNFMHTVLETGLTHDEACEKEKYYIKKFNTTNRECGYNQTLGGEGISGYTFTEEQIQKMRQNNQGKNNPMFGKTGEQHPMFGKKGKSNPNYGRSQSQATKDRISKSKKGVPWTDKQREIYMNLIKRGAENSRARAIKQFSINGDFIQEFGSIADAVKLYGFDASNIVKVCNGKQITAYGYKWQYA